MGTQAGKWPATITRNTDHFIGGHLNEYRFCKYCNGQRTAG